MHEKLITAISYSIETVGDIIHWSVTLEETEAAVSEIKALNLDVEVICGSVSATYLQREANLDHYGMVNE